MVWPHHGRRAQRPHLLALHGGGEGSLMGRRKALTVEKAEIEHRDRILHAYFLGRTWDLNNEFLLKRKLVLERNTLLPSYQYIFDDEWEVETSLSNEGKGDLIFTDGSGHFAVIEVKFIGKTGNRRIKRREVEQQAEKYAHHLTKKIKGYLEIKGFFYTDEVIQPKLMRTFLA